MIILMHLLKLRTPEGEREVEIRIHRPADHGSYWGCSYEIDWPEGQHGLEATGIDALQSLISAFQMIGSEIYTSTYHADGALFAPKRDGGYGFPVPYNIRHLLVGGDSLDFGLVTELPER
jgi:hypothetical protein